MTGIAGVPSFGHSDLGFLVAHATGGVSGPSRAYLGIYTQVHLGIYTQVPPPFRHRDISNKTWTFNRVAAEGTSKANDGVTEP